MTLQTLTSAAMLLPSLSNNFSTLQIDASGEKVGFVVRTTKAGDISKVHFRTSTVANSQTLLISLQAVDLTTGDPNGTADQSGTQASPTSNTWHSVTLGASRTVAAGDRLAVVIEFNATVGDVLIASASTLQHEQSYADLFTSSWAKQGRSPMVLLEYSDGSFSPLVGVTGGLPTQTIYDSTSTPDEIALKFKLPYTAKCDGGMFRGLLGGDVDIVLYDSNGSTVLGTDSLDKDVVQATTGTFVGVWAAATLAANTFYYLSVKPTTSTSARLFSFSVSTAAHLAQSYGGQNFHWAQQTDAGGWTPTTTARPLIVPRLSAFDDATGGGGVLTHPGMSGGLNG
jgi:hypothetical protein